MVFVHKINVKIQDPIPKRLQQKCNKKLKNVNKGVQLAGGGYITNEV